MLSPEVLLPVAVESPVVSLWRSYARVRDERRWKWREQGMGIRKVDEESYAEDGTETTII
ncbi:hypothetical protein V1478_003967 [Vespula squamosa]|uniref:Uncharacterized protein n=1 Tax=Vespula squamosa TaxID=30214 RepID=A0ABD2BNC0_VESSQ